MSATGPKVQIFEDSQKAGQCAAETFIDVVGRLLDEQESVCVMLAAAPSQLSFFRALCRQRQLVDWDRVRLFHMDEYIGLSPSHPASFRSFLHENLVDLVNPREFSEIHGDAADAGEEMVRYTQVLRSIELDVCVMGIGENGHLAFNEPPADFDPAYEMQIVKLDNVTRHQELAETPFDSIDDVPSHALTVTMRTFPRLFLRCTHTRLCSWTIKRRASSGEHREVRSSVGLNRCVSLIHQRSAAAR